VLLADGLGALAMLLALAFVAAGAGFGWVAARSRWLDLGEIEIALWDPARWPGPSGGPAGRVLALPLGGLGGGTSTIRLHAVPPPGEAAPEAEPPPGPAELHPVFSQLVHERRRRGAPWRRHAFAPVLVVNPIDLGRDPELGDAGRLRRLLPVFAALGSARAMIAISRWNAVESVCRPDSDRRATVELATAGMGGQGAVAVSRETLRRLCLDAEDGREGDTTIHYLRYDAGWAEPRIDDDAGAREGDGPAASSVTLTWSDPMSGLEGEARRCFFRFLASLLSPPAAVESVSAVPAGRVGAVE
jgi:hypothetical protein